MSGIPGDVDRWVHVLMMVELKGLALLALCALGVLALRRSSAASRHWVWVLGMAGLLALPLLQTAGPRLSTPVPAWMAIDLGRTTPDNGYPVPADRGAGEPASAVGSAPPRRTSPAGNRAADGGMDSPFTYDGSGAPASTASVLSASLHDAGRMGAPTSAAEGPETPSRPAVARFPFTTLVLGAWMLGALVLLATLAGSHLATHRLAARAVPVRAGGVTRLAERLARRLRIRRPVRLLEGDAHTMPMSWGCFRPAVLLPAGSGDWTPARLEAVLLHELAHVQRADCLTQLLAELALALHWMNPLAWLAARRLRLEREYACDDVVLETGTRASAYADELLALARSFRHQRRSALAALAMARPASLSGRLSAVLDGARSRRFGRRRAVGTGFVAVGLVMTLAGLTPATPGSVAPSAAPASRATSPSSSGQRPVTATAPGQSSEATTTLQRSTPTTALSGSGGAARDASYGSGDAPSPYANAALRSLAFRPDPVPPVHLFPLSEPVLSLPQAHTCGMDAAGWQNVSTHSENGRKRVEWSKPGCDVEVRVEGDIEFNADFTDISRLGRDALFSIDERDGRMERLLEITPGEGGQLEYDYRVDRKDRTFDAAAKAWYRGLLLQLFRRTGFMAHERVAALLRQGGAPAVLRELDQLTSDYVFAAYVQGLLEDANLSDAQALDVVKRTRAGVKSDYYLTSVLEAFAPRYLTSDAMVDVYVEAASAIRSDYYRSEVLRTALDRGDLTTAQVGATLKAASSMKSEKSDYYLSEILTTVAKGYTLAPNLRSVYLEAVASIGSDYYRSEVLKALISRNDLSENELAVALHAASTIKSGTYVLGVLNEATSRGLSSRALRTAYLQVARGIGSDYYRAEALGTLLKRTKLSDDEVAGVVAAGGTIKSDYYKTDVLLAVVRHYHVQGTTRQAVIDAMNTIKSQYYRGQVAQELVAK